MKTRSERDAQTITIAIALAIFLGTVLIGTLLVAPLLGALIDTELEGGQVLNWMALPAVLLAAAYLALHRRQ